MVIPNPLTTTSLERPPKVLFCPYSLCSLVMIELDGFPPPQINRDLIDKSVQNNSQSNYLFFIYLCILIFSFILESGALLIT